MHMLQICYRKCCDFLIQLHALVWNGFFCQILNPQQNLHLLHVDFGVELTNLSPIALHYESPFFALYFFFVVVGFGCS